jgi:hypothetical protein
MAGACTISLTYGAKRYGPCALRGARSGYAECGRDAR